MVPAYLEHLAGHPDDHQRQGRPEGAAAARPRGARPRPASTSRRPDRPRPCSPSCSPRRSASSGSRSTRHFFDDLGANSLLLARFAAQVRARTDAAADRDAGHVPAPHRDRARGARRRRHAADAAATPGRCHRRPVTRPAPLRYLLCGAVQLVLFLVSRHRRRGPAGGRASSGCAAPRPSSTCGSAPWWSAPRRSAATSCCRPRRSGCWSGAGRPQEFPLWGARYLRFWVVQTDPAGQPARRVRGVAALQPVPAGLGAPRRRGRRRPDPRRPGVHGPAHDRRRHGRPQGHAPQRLPRRRRARSRPARSRSARDAVVGEQSVLDIDAVLGDGAQLGHASSLQSGQVVPAGESWHGSPAVPCDVDYRLVAPARCGRLRRFAYGAVAAGQRAGPVRPARPRAGPPLRSSAIPLLAAADASPARRRPATRPFYLRGARLRRGAVRRRRRSPGSSFVATVPRLLQPRACARTPSTRSTGSATGCTGSSRGLTNSRFYCMLFGDSSAIVHYLRLVGYRFGRPLEQTGSNFGVEVQHDNPYLSAVGSGTMVSDGLSFMNAEYSSTSFRLRRARAGRPQLPRQQHRLPGRRPDRRQLPARDEGHGADRRAGPRRRRAARLAGVRDPADGRSATAPSTT